MLEPLPAEQHQLVLGERRVDVRQRDAVKGEIPGGEPGVLPFIRHRHYVEGVEVLPPGAPSRPARSRWWRLSGVALEPAGHVVVIELFAPQHSREGLAHDHLFVRARPRRRQLVIELESARRRFTTFSKPFPSAVRGVGVDALRAKS